MISAVLTVGLFDGPSVGRLAQAWFSMSAFTQCVNAHLVNTWS